jgi:hypothetical protein
MNLDVTLLAKLANWKPGPGRQVLTLPDPGSGWTLALTVDHADQVGCLVWELELRRAVPFPGGNQNALHAWADRIAARTTGLLEALKVLEVDAARDQALLRSDAPAHRNGDRFYYEVHLIGSGTAAVRRYRGGRTGKDRREQVAFALTHEALAKFAADLAAEA